MNGKAVSAALGGLPEDMVAEAMEPGRVRRGFSWLRLAACIALVAGLLFGMNPGQPQIVTAPGILAVTVYAVDETGGYKEIQLQEGIDTGYRDYWPLRLGSVPGIPVRLAVESTDFLGEDVVFEVTVDKGKYCDLIEGKMTVLPSRFTMRNNNVCYWDWSYGLEQEEADIYYSEDYDYSFTDIVIYCEENIVGYAVLRFQRSEISAGNYETSLLASVLFPKVDGKYQNVPLEYVRMCITEIKQ